MSLRSTWAMMKETYYEWSEDNATLHAAAIAYYTILSLAPLLLIAIGIAGLVYGQRAAQGEVLEQTKGIIGPQAAQAVQDMLKNAQKPATNIVTAIVGFITLLIGAGGVFTRLQASMNAIWDVQPRPGLSIWATLRKYLFSYAMLLVIGFLLLVSLAVSATLSVVTKYFVQLLPEGLQFTSHIINAASLFIITTILFAFIFKVLPQVKIPWKNVWVGAMITAILFTLGNVLIGLYLGKSAVASAYGAAGSVILILIWVYYSAQIFFVGAEFTQVWSRRRGTPIVPTKTAQPTPGSQPTV